MLFVQFQTKSHQNWAKINKDMAVKDLAIGMDFRVNPKPFKTSETVFNMHVSV